MPSLKKQSTVATLVAEVKKHPTVVLTEYSGITHPQLENLRRELKSKGGFFHVVKNALLNIALADAKVINKKLDIKGPSAVLLTEADNFAPLKTLYEKARELTSLKIKLGVLNNTLISDAEVINLALLPSKEELIAKLLGQLKSPQSKLVYILKGNLQKLVSALSQIQAKKSVVN